MTKVLFKSSVLVLKRLSLNNKSEQKEAQIGLYIGKYASDFGKYQIMGQALYSGGL